MVGAGWAGCAAAVELSLLGHHVHLVEAARLLGGRARGHRPAKADDVVQAAEFKAAALHPPAADLWEARLDNGQHLLLGAYRESLRLMRVVGVDTDASLLRLPLQMRYPAGCGGMDFVTAKLPAPLHLLLALWRTTGLDRADKMALARFSTTARWIDWRLNDDCSVDQLLERFDQTARVCALLWRPLCLAALNTPSERASAQVFLSVLRDSLGARRAASDMLIPRLDLSTLFPTPAARFVQARGGVVHTGARVTALTRRGGNWHLGYGVGQVDTALVAQFPDTGFDAVILATPLAETARLLHGWTDTAATFDFSYEPITTCYLQYSADTVLPQPLHALVDDPGAGRWGQFVFDRGQLDAAQAGLLAVVVSAAADAAALGQAALAQALANQLAAAFSNPALCLPQRVRVITEKRATFACTPGLLRPPATTGVDGLLRAGDYVDSPYPATIESAVRSGVAAARMVGKG